MEMVILVGIPGSGKTTWYKKTVPMYTHISLDEIDHDRKVEDKMVECELQKGNNIVIDDTNVTRKIRQRHIVSAKKYNATVNVVFFDVRFQKAHQQNSMRKGKKRVPDGALTKFAILLEEPTLDEGINCIKVIH